VSTRAPVVRCSEPGCPYLTRDPGGPCPLHRLHLADTADVASPPRPATTRGGTS